MFFTAWTNFDQSVSVSREDGLYCFGDVILHRLVIQMLQEILHMFGRFVLIAFVQLMQRLIQAVAQLVN